jgi:uncharacterized membrane protein
MIAWLIPTLAYVLLVGALGVTGKLALRTLSWYDLILWTGAGYVLAAGVLLALGRTELRIVSGTGWAVLSGVAAIGGLISLYLALGAGDAGKVTAVSAAYPVCTLLLAAAFLSEPLTVARAAGASLVVGGVIVLTVAS